MIALLRLLEDNDTDALNILADLNDAFEGHNQKMICLFWRQTSTILRLKRQWAH